MAGRPTDYNPEWVNIVPDMFREGQSITEVAVGLGITKQTLYRYMELYPAFSDAIHEGREISQSWWERQGREGLYKTTEYNDDGSRIDRSINDRLWMNNVRFRFPDDWQERKEKTPGSEQSPMRVIIDYSGKIEDQDTVEVHKPTHG